MGVGGDGNTVYSANGADWMIGQSVTTNHLFGVAATSDTFVAVGINGSIISSLDGFSWKTRNSKFSGALLSVAQDGASFLAVGESGAILESSTRSSPFFEGTPLENGLQLRLRANGWNEVQVEASSDLAHWVPVQSFTDRGDGTWMKNDLLIPNTNQFYRAICRP